MKLVKSLSLAVLTAAILAACDGGDKSAPAASQPQAQQAQGSESDGMPADLAAVIDGYPTPDPVLTQPIEISDKKSPTGMKELQKFAELANGPAQRQAAELQQKIQSQLRNQKSNQGPSPELLASIKEMGGVLDKMKQEVAAQNLQDPEVKNLADRAMLGSEFAYKVIEYMASQAGKMDGEAAQKSAAFMNAFNGKTTAMQKALVENQRLVGEAAQKLSEKYSK
ncbi:hypothetical protein [Neisseria bacilliformis]|uniref:hypothetical protein n=1 Tax=Neisseria bacilliformis TaxID=267212 RepID=UPI0028EFC94E|nr:hypothetical protein [Neisseria bacilliformis]